MPQVAIGEQDANFQSFSGSLSYTFQATVGLTDPSPFKHGGFGPMLIWIIEVVLLSLFLLNLLIALLNSAYAAIIDQAENRASYQLGPDVFPTPLCHRTRTLGSPRLR